jgi:lipoprotein-anchoring transpeptidase ErfK/SrfK
MSGRACRHARGRVLPALALVVALAVAALAFAYVLAWSGPSERAAAAPGEGRGSPSHAVPPPVSPAFVPPPPRPLANRGNVSWYAFVRRDAVAREEPDLAATAVAAVPRWTPEETRNIVLVLGRGQGADGRLWVRVRLAALPNGMTGWVPRDALAGYAAVGVRLLVDLERLTARLYRDERVIFRAPVGVGSAEWPTPGGRFYIRNKLTRFANPFYGPLAFGTSARSAVLTDWPAGGYVGIHGTNRPDLIPGRVSHGCIRLKNEDILELGRLMPVGTPVRIQ